MKLTNLTLKSLKSNGRRREESIDALPGLRIRVSATGERKTWVYVYRRAGKLNRLTIGSCSEYSIAKVTETHGRMRRLALDGDDPAKGLPDQRALDRKASGLTVQALAEDYRDHYLRTEVDTADEMWRLLEKDVLPVWGDRQVDSIEGYDLTQILDEIVARGAIRVAERVRSTVRQMFVHGNKRDLTKNFPFSALGPVTSKKQKQRRGKIGRTLSEEEIKIFWGKIETAKMLPRLRPAFKLLLLTAQRRGQLAKTPWHNVDFDKRTWTIEEGDNKSRRQHLVPSGYSPVCGNEWKPGICHKPRVKCGDCNQRQSPNGAMVIAFGARCLSWRTPLPEQSKRATWCRIGLLTGRARSSATSRCFPTRVKWKDSDGSSASSQRTGWYLASPDRKNLSRCLNARTLASKNFGAGRSI